MCSFKYFCKVSYVDVVFKDILLLKGTICCYSSLFLFVDYGQALFISLYGQSELEFVWQNINLRME